MRACGFFKLPRRARARVTKAFSIARVVCVISVPFSSFVRRSVRVWCACVVGRKYITRVAGENYVITKCASLSLNS